MNVLSLPPWTKAISSLADVQWVKWLRGLLTAKKGWTLIKRSTAGGNSELNELLTEDNSIHTLHQLHTTVHRFKHDESSQGPDHSS